MAAITDTAAIIQAAIIAMVLEMVGTITPMLKIAMLFC
jgi:hypothetical protein